MTRCSRLRLGSLLGVLLVAGWLGQDPVPCIAAPEEQGDVSSWTPVDLADAEPKALSDCRSPVLLHETRIAPDTPLAVGGEQLELRLTTGGSRVAWQRTGRAADAKKVWTRGSLAVPGVLALPQLLGRRYALHLRAAADREAVMVSSAMGVVLPLAKGTGYLVDSDRDGVLGSEGDGFVAPESRTVGPWRGEGWTRHGGVKFRQTETGAWEHAALRLPQPADPDHTGAWCLLQWRRQQCGILALSYDRDLEAAMRKHAEYLERNDLETHEEDPGLPGYTPEGDRAGRSSVLGFDDESLLAALEMNLGTLYHRTRPLQPGLTHTALVLHKGIFLLNVFERRGGPLANALLVYPPHGMEKVRLNFHPQGENPMPIADSRTAALSLGTAINVFSEPLRLAASLRAEPALGVVAGKRRREVEGDLHFPGRPPAARVGASNRGNVALVPSRPLRPRTRYEANLRVTLPDGRVFTYRWWFSTIGRRK